MRVAREGGDLITLSLFLVGALGSQKVDLRSRSLAGRGYPEPLEVMTLACYP